MEGLRLLPASWNEMYEWYLNQIQESAIIASPFIQVEPVERLCKTLTNREVNHQAQITVLTNLSPSNLVKGVLDPYALLSILDTFPQAQIVHLPRLHAKVYLADDKAAIITSGNLTEGGIKRNYEYGVCIENSSLVSLVREDITSYARLGAVLKKEELILFATAAQHVKNLNDLKECSLDRKMKEEFQAAIVEMEKPIIQARIRAESENHVFAQTILYILKKEGPLRTDQLHPLVKDLHPDLCDDALDRVISGKRFGKRWKHMVRNAQQYLNRNGQIQYDPRSRLWMIKAP